MRPTTHSSNIPVQWRQATELGLLSLIDIVHSQSTCSKFRTRSCHLKWRDRPLTIIFDGIGSIQMEWMELVAQFQMLQVAVCTIELSWESRNLVVRVLSHSWHSIVLMEGSSRILWCWWSVQVVLEPMFWVIWKESVWLWSKASYIKMNVMANFWGQPKLCVDSLTRSSCYMAVCWSSQMPLLNSTKISHLNTPVRSSLHISFSGFLALVLVFG